MSEEVEHKPYEWADALFSNKYDIDPKYRDMLAMLAACMMGEQGAAQHFYNQAIVDGASDEELARVAQAMNSSLITVGDLESNVEQAAMQIRAEQEQSEGPQSEDSDKGNVN